MDLANGNRDDHLGDLLQDQAIIWNHTFSFIKSMSLKCAIELGIPDIIHNHGQPMTLHHLTKALPIHPTKTQFVSRLMRMLVHSGFFAIDQNGYVLTRTSHLLLKTSPYSSRYFVLGMLDPVLKKPWHYMSAWFQNDDETAFNTCFGVPLWGKAEKDQRVNNFFNAAMASDSLLIGKVLTRKCQSVFKGLESLVDVGGGTGTLARTIAEAFPSLECTVYDLPHVVGELEDGNNLKYIGGNMFESIPSADAILLKWILHDWNDEVCTKILKNCKKAIAEKGKGRKIIIIDIVMESQTKDRNAVESKIFFDLEVMILVPGQERNEKQWAKLFFDAGFSGYKIYPVFGLRSLIEVFL